MDQAKKKTVWPYWVFGSITALASIAYGAMTYWQSSGIMAAFAMICLVLARLADFESLIVGPNKLEFKQFSKNLKIECLESVVTIVLYQLYAMNRWSSSGRNETTYKMKNKILEALRRSEVPNEAIKKILEENCRPFDEIDYVSYALNSIHGDIRDNNDALLKRKMLSGRPIGRAASAEETEQFLQEHGLLTPERLEIIEDYKYYTRCGEHRNLDKWFKQYREP